jgi:hypothetical protein
MPVRWLLAILVFVFYLLHQDVWFWRRAQPLVFGVLPIGLFYHACYTLAVSALVWVLIKFAWPSHLDSASIPSPRSRDHLESIPSPRLRDEG